MNDELPPAVVHRAMWDDAIGWKAYHDEHDPLPTEWDDGPPDEVQGFYSGDQMREYASGCSAPLLARIRELEAALDAAHTVLCYRGWRDFDAEKAMVDAARAALKEPTK